MGVPWIGRRRRLLYDLGCAWSGPNPGTFTKFISRFGTRAKRDDESQPAYYRDQLRERLRRAEASAAIGSSILLFRSLYERQCLEFDHIYAWEATPYPPGAWMSRLNHSLPDAERHKISFFNEPVNETNVFDVLQQTAHPDDFVVFKLDIDSPRLEEWLVRRILAKPELHSLVDELFYEYHGHVDDRDGAAVATPDLTVAHGLHQMRALRRLGIRSHFWV